MKTHNVIIYHCLSCGSVKHCEPEVKTPDCCGKPMVRAAAETIANHTAPGAEVAGRPESEPGPPEVPRKPR